MNIFARSVMWALPFWVLLMLTHIANPYLWVIIVAVETITYPGYAVCLWLSNSIHDLDWFIIILLNIVIYYAAVLIIIFVIDRSPSLVGRVRPRPEL